MIKLQYYITWKMFSNGICNFQLDSLDVISRWTKIKFRLTRLQCPYHNKGIVDILTAHRKNSTDNFLQNYLNSLKICSLSLLEFFKITLLWFGPLCILCFELSWFKTHRFGCIDLIDVKLPVLCFWHVTTSR